MANVNVPTNTAIKERDVNQKLQLYGIFTGFQNGKVPSNKQIDVALNSFLASKALSKPSSRLSSEGQTLVADVREVVKQAKYLLLSKNEGNLLQDFIWQCQSIDGANAGLPGAPTDKATAQQHGNEALDGLKTLGTLILSNGQFRKLLKDAQILARDIAGDAAQNAANKVNPSEDALKRIDEPAEDNTWHDVPDLSRENIRGQVRASVDKNKPFSRQEAKDVAAGHAQQTAEENDPQNRQQGQQAAQQGIQNAAGDLKARAQQNVPQETQDRARESKEIISQKSKNYYNKKMPQERREQTVYRLKKMIVEIQGHSDYQQAIETLLNLAETYGGHAKSVANQSGGTLKDAHNDNNLRTAEQDLRTLIERFANSTSTEDLFDSLNQIYRDADRDPELKNWFKRLDRFIRNCLQEQGYILREQSDREWDQIYDQGQYLLRERYRNHTDRILDEVKFLADQFDQDPQNTAFGNAVQKLFLDLGQDENGKSTFKPHLIKDLTEVIIPAIFENTRYVPIPRIEVSDPMIDMVIENLVVESDNLFPNTLEFSSDNYFRMGRKNIRGKNENKVMISASGVQMDLRDVAYYIKKKEGFPSITDKGVMDIILSGEGFGFKIAARNAQKSDRTHFVVVDNVDVQIKNLQIKIKQSNHKLLFAIAKPLVLKVMKPAIQKVLEKQIKENFEKGDAYLWSVYQDAQKEIEKGKQDPENAGNIYQNYVTAWQRKMTAKKEQAKNKASNTKVNVAMTQQDSMFKHIALPGGISTKATEYRELAGKGNKWESPVFGIGSAKESTDIPRLTPVSRKPHSTAPSTVRGGNKPGSTASTTDTLTDRSQGYGNQGYGGQQGYGNTGSSGYDNTGSGNYGAAGAGGAAGMAGAGLAGAGAGGYGAGTGSGAGGYGSGAGSGLGGSGLGGTGGYGAGDTLTDRSVGNTGYNTQDANVAGQNYTSSAPTGYGSGGPGEYGNTGTTVFQPQTSQVGGGSSQPFDRQVDQAFNTGSAGAPGNSATGGNNTYYDGVTR